MKTLKNLASEFSLYQLNDIPEQYKNENFDHRVKSNFKEIPEQLTKVNDIEIGLFYECKQDTSYDNKISYYIEHAYILLKHKDNDNLLMLMHNKGKYYLHPYYGIGRKYQNISHYIRQEAIKELKEPNWIGVFTDKKVNDWINYCNQYLQAMEKALNEVNDKNAEIEKSIQDFIESLPTKNTKVQKYQNKTYIYTNLFDVTFEHHKDQKYLNTQISFKGSLKDVTKIENIGK